MDSDIDVVSVTMGARPYHSEEMDSDVVVVGDGSAARSSSQGSSQTRMRPSPQTQAQSQAQPRALSQQQNAAPKPDEPLERLEKALENACQTLYALSTGVHDFSYDNQHVIFSKVNEFVRDLRDIDDCSKHVNAVIPSEVIDAIDKGRNPEWCTYQMLYVFVSLICSLSCILRPSTRLFKLILTSYLTQSIKPIIILVNLVRRQAMSSEANLMSSSSSGSLNS